ncbi:MAG TPA: hypothetical protein DCE23_02435 [Firmicutes bacterium]|nr:hypothetical protein [Bacillota bacterium]
MIDALISLAMIKKTGTNICRGIYYNYISRIFDLNDFLTKYENDLNNSVRTLSLVEPSFVSKEVLKSCFDTLKENITPEELILVTNRLQDIKVKRGLFSFTNNGIFNNSLNLLKYYTKKSLMHEFLHLASSYYNKENKIWLCGFESSYKALKIGRGITEGYTELFASRFEKREVHSYKEITEICELLELLFDNHDDVRKLYFSCDFPSFIKKLREYMTIQEAFNLIREIDLLIYNKEISNSLNIKLFIYKKFIEKCHDKEKISNMIALITKQEGTATIDDTINKHNSNIENQDSSESFRRIAKNSIKKAVTTAAICTSLLLTSNIFISPNSIKEASRLVNAHMTNNYSVSFTDDYYLSYIQTNNSINGTDLYTSLIRKDIEYFSLNDEYYTKSGGEITIEDCEITIKKYLGDANEKTEHTKEKDSYIIENGKVYSVSYINYQQVTLSDGRIITPVFDIAKNLKDNYYINLISKRSVMSKSFNELKDLYLISDSKEERLSGKTK